MSNHWNYDLRYNKKQGCVIVKTFGNNSRFNEPENYKECRKMYCEDCYYWNFGQKPKDCKQRIKFEKEISRMKIRHVVLRKK